MVQDKLPEFIQTSRSQGLSDTQIRSFLMQQGLETAAITAAFAKSTPTSLPSIFSLLAAAWRIYKAHFFTYVGILLMTVLTLLLFYALLVGGVVLGFFTILSGFTTAKLILIPLLVSTILIIGVYVVAWGPVALMAAVTEPSLGFKKAYRTGWKKIITFGWVMSLASFAILGGFFLLGVVAILCLVWFSFATFLLFTEDVGGMTALLKSKYYVKGRFFGIFFRLVPVWLVFPILNVVVSLVFHNIYQIGIIEGLLAVIGFFLGPFFLLYQQQLYLAAKSMKDDSAFHPKGKSKLLFVLLMFVPLVALGIFALTVPQMLSPIVNKWINSTQKPKLEYNLDGTSLDSKNLLETLQKSQYGKSSTNTPKK